MTTQIPAGDREKVVSKLPALMRQDLKVRAAERSCDIQDAVLQGLQSWMAKAEETPLVATTGAIPFATHLPVGVWSAVREVCAQRGIPLVQGLSQAVQLWLTDNPSPKVRPFTGIPQRLVVCNQKGGVGKTAVAAGLAQAMAEDGKRVLLIDFDPQGHLTDQLGLEEIPNDKGHDSLAKHMVGDNDGPLERLLVPLEHEKFGGRLFVLPTCMDAFLLDTMLALATKVRTKESALEKALRPVESLVDVVIIDCPPTLGTTMDTALYYARRRDGEAVEVSGVVIPVQAEDSSAKAFRMLDEQISSLEEDFALAIEYLGFVVNLYESRRGFVATSSLERWEKMESPRLLAVIGDLKEQREAVRMRQPLLVYSEHCEQSEMMRTIARRLS
ncbi:ParA family protein [Streptomyces sp. ISL-87]|uniref:ParA family protein n=1 Tax=Streptomyces sp. ISL-87 TaxID=2819188 RepID=UPI001BEADCCD|nr:ParA family protein [Streptomyces sp. ISL-87]MBT2611442.1 ParA family protein [Streptomyces sp. ISL-87]